MKIKILWWLLLAIGTIPFVAPFISFAYELLIASSWTLTDWLVMYSFVYWPTYILGFALIAISANKLMK